MKQPRYDKGPLAEVARSSTSMRQVLKRLNIAPYGGNYGVLRRALTRYGIDTSHFTGQAWNRGLRTGARTSTALYLTNALLPRAASNVSE